MEVECLGVGFMLAGGDIFNFDRDFFLVVVKMEMEDLELELGTVVRLVWGFLNEKIYFLWHLSWMSVEGKMSNVSGHSFGMVIQVDFLIKLFFLDGGHLGKVTGAKLEMVVIILVVGVVAGVVCVDLGVLLKKYDKIRCIAIFPATILSAN